MVSPDVGTIVNALVALLSGLATAIAVWWGQREKRRARHLRDLKSRCLQPLREELSRLRTVFLAPFYDLSLTSYLPMIEALRGDAGRWCESYTFTRPTNRALYEDLENHYPELYECLRRVEGSVRVECPRFFRALVSLLDSIGSDHEFRELEGRLRGLYGDEYVTHRRYPLVAAALAALGADTSQQSSELDRLGPHLTEVWRLGSRLRDSREAAEIRSISERMLGLIDSCSRIIDEVMLETRLRGRCKYV